MFTLTAARIRRASHRHSRERVRSRLPLLLSALAIVCLLEPNPAATTGNTALGGDRFRGPFGRGAAQVWVLTPNRAIRDVVVFGHGWKVAPPSPAYSWVGQFRPWLNHLVARGSAVIFPRYQLGTGDPQDAQRVRDFATGIRIGYAHLGTPTVPFVAVGYSFGASLAFYYAADARRWHLPQPRAVDAIFPAGLIPDAPLPTLPSSTRVLIQVGDADTDAGSTGADQFWHWLSQHPAHESATKSCTPPPASPQTMQLQRPPLQPPRPSSGHHLTD